MEKNRSHSMIGKLVQVRGVGRVFEIKRVVESPRFGELCRGPLPEHGEQPTYYLIGDCRVVEEMY
jgi:hypothetical protein